MSKWPKPWYEALGCYISNPDSVLNALEQVGALKEQPKPIEIYWCIYCRRGHEKNAAEIEHWPADAYCGPDCAQYKNSVIKMREVINE